MNGWENFLVTFDTDRIKQFLLTTNRLKEIRGGSTLIAQMDGERQKYLEQRYGNDSVVYSAGGGAAVLVPTEEEARTLVAEIERDFREKTTTATITGIYLLPELDKGRGFGKRMKKAGEYLRHAKAAGAGLYTLPVEPYMRLCDSCGMHPAEIRAENGDLLCRSCAKKRRLGSKKRWGFFDHFARWADPQIWSKETIPKDLDSIGAVSSPPNYVGFIALDGNHIGDLLSQPTTVKNYHRFSEELVNLTQEQIYEALKRFAKPRNVVSSEVSPFEIVFIGGDDVLLITAAGIAIEIALAVAEGFEQHSLARVLKPGGLERVREKLTMAAGIVLAHADFPIPAMYRLAEDLQKSAKKYCASQNYKTGAVDFLVVSGSDVDLEEMRRTIPHRRPYTLEDMQRLIGYVRQFKEAGFPTSQLQAMYQALFESEVNAQLASIATLGYLGKRTDRKLYNLLKGFFADFGVKFNGQLPPWDTERCGEHRASALTDLVELYPFVHDREREENQ